jgi:hypothetical protein
MNHGIEAAARHGESKTRPVFAGWCTQVRLENCPDLQ